MFTKRMWICLASGAVLGIVCIVGAFIRSGFESDGYFLFSLWYNRLLMGLVIGAGWKNLSLPQTIARGAVLGLIVSFAFYSSTGFSDLVSFLAGIVYGVIIEYVANRFTAVKRK
ncbi:MAG: hypothetical protein K9H14_00620 [Actinomycetia bacterium]|nr:hypothetical protein [Actinomycetes bacterium]